MFQGVDSTASDPLESEGCFSGECSGRPSEISKKTVRVRVVSNVGVVLNPADCGHPLVSYQIYSRKEVLTQWLRKLLRKRHQR